ncbi:MAG: SsrA-binding protein SmpB [bacterium]|nr:SsrA-binding protein SmpB [bacterium]
MEAITNKRAYFDYKVLETYEAGIELLGFEVKSVRKGSMSLRASFVTVKDGQLWLTNAVISPFQPQNTPAGYDSSRSRKLLLHKKEIARLIGKLKEKGLTMVPLKVYNKNSKIKVEIGVVRGKKQYDKRDTIKKRDTEREIRREV